MKSRLLIFAFIFISSLCFGDTYPKNTNIDVLLYTFRIELSDDTDEIKCEETVDVRYLADGVEWLRLDLVKASAALQNKGMRVSGVVSN
ncbi:MAG: hypothetical protein RIE59_02820, partial [Imperialibacter sp.]